MKKVSLMIAALALVLGLSQCKKQEKPIQSGETQHIVLTTGNGNDGSKVAADFLSDALKLTWETTDEIKVEGAATGTLGYVSGAGYATATFAGDITRGEGDEVTFSVGSEPVYTGQPGTQDWIKGNIYLVGRAPYSEDGVYEGVAMNLPYAILKLDLSYFAPTDQGGDVTVKITEKATSKPDPQPIIASVTCAVDSLSAVYVAIPAEPVAQGSAPVKKTYIFSDGTKTVELDFPIGGNVFYTASGTEGGSVVIEPAAPSYTFTVAAGKTVTFAPGNLYWDGSAFKFEANQWSYATSWDASHVSYFFWSKSSTVAVASSYSDPSAAAGDVFFTNATETTANPDFQVSGETAGTWRTLKGGYSGEWLYLIESRTNASNLWGRGEVNGCKGLIILPDGCVLPSDLSFTPGSTTGWINVYNAENWAKMEAVGAVFLPAAGYRSSTSFNQVDSWGRYWSSSYNSAMNALSPHFTDSQMNPANGYSRSNGFAVRLVKDN